MTNTALSWTKTYIPDLGVSDQGYTNAMTLLGTKVEGLERPDKNLEKIVVSQITKTEQHPDADKLIVCQVDIGDSLIRIVIGAPNVKGGDKVPVVLKGGKVAGGHNGGPLPEEGIKIKKGRLRGIKPYGMMCSIEELGSFREIHPDAPESGIHILPADTKVGVDAVEVLGLRDAVLEYEIMSNRVDCYSAIGIAKEAAVTFDKKFAPPVVIEAGNSEDIHDYLNVTVENDTLCPRYCARMVKNIKPVPSPEWMQRCLAVNGIRSINNLTDITNYMMEECGQPVYTYDYDLIAGHEIIVKRAKDGDAFQILDGQERELDSTILMINDGEEEVGIAGIMGGENSKITSDAKTMVFEAACLDGTDVRLSAKKVGLRADVSGKLEKGLDPNNTEEAIDRACQLVELLGAGEVVGGMIDIYPAKREKRRIPFDAAKINKFLGIDIPESDMLGYSKKLGLGSDAEKQGVIVPTFCQDLEHPADIAEEVVRFYGCDNIPTTLPSGEATTGGLSRKLRVEQVAREIAELSGFSQSMTHSFENPKAFDRLMLPADSILCQTADILNPLGEDFSVMRTTLLNGMLTFLSTNYNRRNKNVRLYELANVYLSKQLPLTELPDERMQFILGFYGGGNLSTTKGVVEEFFEKVGMKKKPHYDPEAGRVFLHSGRQASIVYDGVILGYLGEVHLDVANNYKTGEKTYTTVLDMSDIPPFATFDRKYEGVIKHLAVTRDISMVVPKDVPVGQIEDVIEQRGGKILESYQLFDVYEGAQILAGLKSVAYFTTFRAKDRILEDKEVNTMMEKILHGLRELNIELRA